jgi:hypothetical protein
MSRIELVKSFYQVIVSANLGYRRLFVMLFEALAAAGEDVKTIILSLGPPLAHSLFLPTFKAYIVNNGLASLIGLQVLVDDVKLALVAAGILQASCAITHA